MANPEHLEILKRGVKEWNQWREAHPDIRADLRWADLSETILVGANLSGTDLIGANLSAANLLSAKLSAAKLIRADLSGAKLSRVNLSGANLSGANLTDADLSWANLSKATLQDTSLQASRLINANFDGANLTRARLWETQRAGWSIKGIICESIYWDEKRKKLDTFEPGEFERLYSEKARVQIKYPGGISTLEIATLPGLIRHLEALHPRATLRFESIRDASGGAVVNLTFDDVDDISPEQIEELRTTIQLEAEQKAPFLRQALEGEKQTVLLLKGEIQSLERTVDKLLLNQKPNIYLSEGDLNMSSDTYNISGQAGAVGQNASASNMTFNQIVNNFEQSIDLQALAKQLAELRQAMSQIQGSSPQTAIALGRVAEAEIAAREKNPSKVVESLKAAGEWTLDFAKEIGKEVIVAAIKQSMGMP